MSDLISRQAVENITWEEPSYSDPLNVLTEVRDKVRELPSADIMECARALKKACGEIDCAFCPIHYLCGVEDIRPFDWNLPEGEKE